MMKRVFVYGDSNVWGDNLAGPRVPYYLRWTNRLRKTLRNDYKFIVNGVCSRVAGDYRSDKPSRNGQSYFRQAYEAAGHVDIVIIALGTNDLQERFGRSVNDIINDLLWYRNVANQSEVIYVLPPNFSDAEESGPEFTTKSQKIRSQLIENKDRLVNYIVVENIELSDGVHFSAQGHKMMAKIVGERLKAEI